MTVSKALKPFKYSDDGFTVIDIAVGDERDFTTATDGLTAEGYIVAATVKPVAKIVHAAEPAPDPVDDIEVVETKPVPRAYKKHGSK